MVNIVLLEPEIPMNTGNIARTCAATGSRLHLVGPLGFDISDKAVKRAGLDYWYMVDIFLYDSADEFFAAHGNDVLRLATSRAERSYADVDYPDDCYIIFGKETAGISPDILSRYHDSCVRIPMMRDARCLNLSNSAAIMCYEALRQQGFPGLETAGEPERRINSIV